MGDWVEAGSRKREIGDRLADVGVSTMKRRVGGRWVDVVQHDRLIDNTTPLPIPMRIGLRTISSAGASVAQQTTDWNNAVALFGPMTLTRGPFYSATDSLPAQPPYFTPQGVVQIPSFRNNNLSSITSFMQHMRGPEKLITFHVDPENDYTGSGGGPTFITQFRTAYDAVKAANPEVQVGMVADASQYVAGQHGVDGSFIPPADKCDFYGIDTYRSGASTGDTGSGALIGLADVVEFQAWYGYVKDLGKPLYVTKYGRGFTYSAGQRTSTGAIWTQAQVDNVLARRPGLIWSDYQWLKAHGFAGMNLWWNDYASGDDKWAFTDQPSIDAWASVVQAEGGTPPPPQVGLQRFGTTLFGQSFSRFKQATLGSGSPRYNATESETHYTLNGTLRKGGAVTRVYGGNSPGTWSSAKVAPIRDGQAIIYSFKGGTEGETTFKANFRAFLNSKPINSEFCWLCFWHEPDDEIFKSGPAPAEIKSFPGVTGTDTEAKMKWWLDRNRWCREVINEPAFASRTDFRFGCIFTGVPYEKSIGINQPRSWNDFWTRMKANAGNAKTWDYMGADHYNPAWKGVNLFQNIDDWVYRYDQCNAATGLPIVIGEYGSARPYGTSASAAYTYAQLDQMRADWLRSLMTLIRDRGYFDACSWWREPALDGPTAAFGTIMATPTGYDAQLAAAGLPGPPGGYDAPGVIDAHAEFNIRSIALANAAGVGPVLTYFT